MRKLRILLCCCLMMMPILACADSTPLAGYRICIDPGHQARLDDRQEPIAPGSTKTKMRAAGCAVGVRTHVRESVRNLEIALKLRDALEQMGAEVLLTRDTEDVWVSNVQRAQMANQFRADVYLRLHCNAHGNPRKRGICIYAPRRSAECLLGIAPAQMLAWSEAMADTLQCATGAPSARATTTNAYSGSNWALMPTFLIEMGYFSNVED
ncbi:MAG: N-acetylmuramoyl-L-alanine amidase, partial [Clostridia bacterium]